MILVQEGSNVYDLPELELSDAFAALTPLMEARGLTAGGELAWRPPGQELDALREAVPDFRAAVIDSGKPDGVVTRDLVTLPYPTKFALWRSPTSPAPYLWFTNRMTVIQWHDADGRRRTLVWEPSDHERGEYTPYFARLKAKNPLPDSMLSTAHGTVLGHLQALGIDPDDVDYLAFDHLHTQDVRRLIGTTRPAPDLGNGQEPVEPWFKNAKLIVQAREWETIRHLHPLQVPWYQPETYNSLPTERLLAVDGDVLLGPGVALMYTPGHTAGNMSLVLHTERGLWTSSENGVAAECWAPRASRIPGVRKWSLEWGQDVIMNANTLEYTAWQYDSMVVESEVADRAPDGVYPQCFPTSELTSHPLSPMTAPTHAFGGIEHGMVRGGAITPVGA
ncbi:MAG: hypothetical protein R3320_04780 [Nitriliruptorales bacterium]|nr:hypothetical protein [Nitriliruptorales bacterium]